MKKTLEELDRKNGIEDSVMWKSPEDFEMEEKRERSRKRFRGEEFDDVDVTGEREIGAKGFSNYVVELDEEDDEVVEKDGHGDLELMRIKERDKEEEEEWLSFDVSFFWTCLVLRGMTAYDSSIPYHSQGYD